MKAERKLEPVKDASHLYEVERRDRHAERPGSASASCNCRRRRRALALHTNISDTFYVLEGRMRSSCRTPSRR